jgi:sec-independent protein translocase protein TatA
MFDVGGGELLLIFLAVLLLFGPKKIPEVMRSVGKGLRQFRQAQEGLKQQMRDLSADVEKMTNVEEPTIRVTPKKVEQIPTQIVSPAQISMDIETQFPQSDEEQFSETETTVIVPKPAESIVSRNQPPAKRVFDDTVYDNGGI